MVCPLRASLAILGEPFAQLRIAIDGELRIEKAQAVEHEGGPRFRQLRAPRRGGGPIDGVRLREVPVGRNAGERLRIEIHGRRRQVRIDVKLGPVAPDEERVAGVRERACHGRGGAAVAIHRGVAPLKVMQGAPVARCEARERDRQQERDPDRAAA